MSTTLRSFNRAATVGIIWATLGVGGVPNAAWAAENQTPRKTYVEGDLSVEYPASWRPFSSQGVNATRAYMTAELKKSDRTLLTLAMFMSPDEQAAFFISQVRTGQPLTADETLAERRNVYAAAKQAGDVTQVNTLEKAKLKGLPAVVEDVERNDGRRGRTAKLLKGSLIIEISCVVRKTAYGKHATTLDEIIESLKTAD